MKVPVGWLREYVSVAASTAEIAERLAVSTCEVERIAYRGVADVDGNLGLYRVGRVLEAGKHPNADRLQLCRVDVGEGEPRQIVCGAWNFGAGATVAVALPGAVLPGGQRLERAKLRGIVSDGMILSERELELGPDHAGILVLEEPVEPGTPLADVLPLGEQVLELETTGNRPDLLSVYGIAREVATLFGGGLAPPPGRDAGRADDEPVDVRVDDPAGCPVYIGRLFRGVRVAPSPPWLRARLSAAGMRPISNVVDVTNYVMLALGNPLHAFDLDRLGGQRIVVRRAREGEDLVTLDGVARELDERDLVIADGSEAVAIAGVMGGEANEVTERTENVLLEAANFEPVSILRSSERLRLRTEGSNRWEKGVDPYLAAQAGRLATELIVELSGARFAGEADVRAELPPPPVVSYRPARADAIAGVETPEARQREILERLGFDVQTADVPGPGPETGPAWTLTVPSWRARDVTREIDVVEEVARLELDRVPFTLPERRVTMGRLTGEQRLRRLLEDVLVGCGVSEAYTPSLVASDADPAAYRIPEPQTEDHAVLRTTLIPSLVEAARANVAVGNRGIRLFEIARVYLPRGGDLPEERDRVSAVLEGGFSRVKGIVETLHSALKVEPRFERARGPLFHPGQTAGVEAGMLGALHPGVLEGEWAGFELDLATLLAGVPPSVRYRDVITYPAVLQDMAFVVPEHVQAGDLVEAARAAVGDELREMRVFDLYRGEQVGEGNKSLAFSVAFQSPERTLSDEDAAELRTRIVAALESRFGARLRA